MQLIWSNHEGGMEESARRYGGSTNYSYCIILSLSSRRRSLENVKKENAAGINYLCCA
jgi:hypothetical protein